MKGIRWLGALCLFVSTTAHAEEELQLAYEAPSECDGASAFRARMMSLVRSPPETWKNAVDVHVTITHEGSGYVGRLAVASPAERVLRANNCSSVVAALAVSAALAVDEAVAEATAPEPPPAPPPPPSSTPEPPRREKPRPRPAPAPPKRAPLEIRAGDELGVRTGLAPDSLVLQNAWISAGRRNTWWPPPLRADLTFGTSPITRTTEGAFRTRLFGGGLSACTPTTDGFFAVMNLCAGFVGAALQTSSYEVERPTVRTRSWGGAFFAPRAAIPILNDLRVVVAGSVILPFVRETEAFYAGSAVYEADAVALQVTLGLEVTLPHPARW